MNVSMLVSTYNRPDALQVCLDSICKQTVLPNEVIVCDDGSTKETAEIIDFMREKMPIPIVHVWHEDKGFRKTQITNKGVAVAKGEYIISIDGDILCHPNFVEDHLREPQQGTYIRACRVFLSKKATEQICKSKSAALKIPFYSKMIEKKAENVLRWPCLSHFLATRYKKSRYGLLGGNCSFFRNDFIKVNGYDELFEGWGSEDNELGYRLYNCGLNRKYLKFSAIAFHLWHENAARDRYKSFNKERARYSKLNNIKWCANGVDKYLDGRMEICIIK